MGASQGRAFGTRRRAWSYPRFDGNRQFSYGRTRLRCGALLQFARGRPGGISRAAAVQAIGRKQLLREMQGVWFDQRQADKLRDEAPSAYKDIFAVMRA